MTRVFNRDRELYPADAVYIGRGSMWGNPYKIGRDGDRDEVVSKFETIVLPELDLRDLIGKNLVCHCHPQRCHGHSIMTEINRRYNKAKTT
jgi:hypothetical protein